MNSQRTGLRVAAVLFGLVAIAHILRLFKHAKINIASHVIPMEASWIFIIVFGLLCFWMWKLSAR
ncbi:MAG TPA: hypothetical protein VFA58_08495 [Chthoniobacterales bacterium]|nr:hypothetical protein [Chthoniobacterales bacterium]